VLLFAPVRRPVARAAVAATALVALLGGMLGGCALSAEDRAEQTIAAASSESATFTLAAPADVIVTEDVPVGPLSAGRSVDICRAEGSAEPRPAVLAVHGGSWARGDKAHPNWRTVCAWLAGEGFVGVSVNYRLAPEHPFPAGADDVATAAAWAQSPAAEGYGIDPDRTALLGGSAGGNLAALVALEAAAGSGSARGGLAPIDAVVTLSSPLDLAADAATSPTFEQSMLDYLNCTDRASCPAAAAASPQTFVTGSAPHILVVHGMREQLIPVQQAEAFISALQIADAPVTAELIDSEAHSIGLLDVRLADRIAEWLRSVLVPAPVVEALDDGDGLDGDALGEAGE